MADRHPVLRAAERRAQRRAVEKVSQPYPEAIGGFRAASEPPRRRKEKICACCGAMTAPLHQFWNQDCGFGLCGPCADWIETREGAEYLAQNYGRRGVHVEGKEILDNGKL